MTEVEAIKASLLNIIKVDFFISDEYDHVKREGGIF